MKETQIREIAKKCDLSFDSLTPLKDEASGRSYWRVSRDKESFVLCYLNPNLGDHESFISVAEQLDAHDINAPKIISHHPSIGVTIQDDLGEDDLISVMNDQNRELLTNKSIDLLVNIHKADIKGLVHLSASELKDQMHKFKYIFCERFLDISIDESVNVLIMNSLDSLQECPKNNCHFDFERRNLILDKHKEVNVIDFQDMCIAPIGIDIAGILLDHYMNFDRSIIKKNLKYFLNQSDISLSEDDLFEFFRWSGIQRNMRILGTLANLYCDEGRDFRLKDLPNILSNLTILIPDNHNSKSFFEDKVKNKLTERLAVL